MTQKIIGVLGGMGPAATVELFSRIVNNTLAENDNEHVNMIIINDPSIPDRTNYILGKGESPVPKLQYNIDKLVKTDADIVVIPCMTAHTFIPELQINTQIPIINGIELIEEYVNRKIPQIGKIGLLATTGSVKSGVFSKYLTTEILTPSLTDQAKLMNIIYGKAGIKAGYENIQIVNELNEIIKNLKNNGAEAVIAGCTELGLVMNEENTVLPIIDPISLLAKKVVQIGCNYNTVG